MSEETRVNASRSAWNASAISRTSCARAGAGARPLTSNAVLRSAPQSVAEKPGPVATAAGAALVGGATPGAGLEHAASVTSTSATATFRCAAPVVTWPRVILCMTQSPKAGWSNPPTDQSGGIPLSKLIHRISRLPRSLFDRRCGMRIALQCRTAAHVLEPPKLPVPHLAPNTPKTSVRNAAWLAGRE
jgi:hypothetical protein